MNQRLSVEASVYDNKCPAADVMREPAVQGVELPLRVGVKPAS